MADMRYENDFYLQGYKCIAGTDEAGRGCLAGPLVVSAVILPEGYVNPSIDDSKRLTRRQREKLFDVIIRDAVSYSIVEISPEEIDNLNIYQASRIGMVRAIDRLRCSADVILSDAMPFHYGSATVVPLIKGDQKSISIAAASILAKVHRDRIMDKYDLVYPGYDFRNNKGYGTRKHLEALSELGITPIHRKSYAPVYNLLNQQLKLEI